jgi:hypothetical protein
MNDPSHQYASILQRAEVLYKKVEPVLREMTKYEADFRELGTILNELRPLVAHGHWLKLLKEKFPLISSQRASEFMRIAAHPEINNPTRKGSLREISQVQIPTGGNLIAEAKTSAHEFMQAVEQKKREDEVLFSNQGKFMLNRITDSLTQDAPGKGLPDLLVVDKTYLSPSDLDLALQLTEACGQLAIRAANWHKKLKEKFGA